jgi:hypothetical protein
MANCCLMIEALESFYYGWKDTRPKGMGKKAFRSFFSRVPAFDDLKVLSDKFYENIRCGILHQAETTGGWRISRKGPLFNSGTLTINATAFLNELKNYLHAYQDELNKNDWGSLVYKDGNKTLRLCKGVLSLAHEEKN